MSGERALKIRRALWAAAVLATVAGLVALGMHRVRRPIARQTPIPTPACVEPRLTLGETTLTIRYLPRDATGDVALPSDAPYVAYWIEGTTVHYWFAVSPDPANLALLAALTPGAPAVITWADCSTDAYQIESLTAEPPDLTALDDQSAGGLSVFVAGAGPEGRYVRAIRSPAAMDAEPASEESTGQTAEEPAEVLVDVLFGGTVVAADGQTLTISITLTNVGSKALLLTEDDLAMYPEEDGPPTPPLVVTPELPRELAPGAELALQITFPNPRAKVVVFQVLDLFFEQYY